jgi:hypothetical protein
VYAEAVQVVGTFVTIAGLVVVAPDAAGRVMPDTWRAVLSAGRWARGWLARWLPRLRRNAEVNAPTMSGTAQMGDSEVGFMTVTLHDPPTTLEERFDRINDAIASIYNQMDDLRSGQDQSRAESARRHDQLHRDHAELRQQLERQQKQRRQLDYRGFPLAALGALLAGLPDSWLVTAPVGPASPASPTWAWWPLLAAGLVVAGVGVRWLVHARGEVRRGWREGWAEVRPPKPTQEEQDDRP